MALGAPVHFFAPAGAAALPTVMQLARAHTHGIDKYQDVAASAAPSQAVSRGANRRNALEGRTAYFGGDPLATGMTLPLLLPSLARVL